MDELFGYYRKKIEEEMLRDLESEVKKESDFLSICERDVNEFLKTDEAIWH